MELNPDSTAGARTNDEPTTEERKATSAGMAAPGTKHKARSTKHEAQSTNDN
jgi:hypothetical protein